ncbi:MAG: dihydrodipicolinate synthase family protein [candidate division KSB1 bacterium]|nr:dihydrodipicolinate synthase family protein [candidate division KSB1 bacterium]MDZ7340149.1 dihydrodipicolinate synthase family protein [candidate division KSB1 bacterium]
MIFEQFKGAFAPLPTPFTLKDRAINFDLIRQHLEFLNARGIQGVVVLGTNGEFPSLAIEERRNVLSWVMKFRGKLKVIAQTGSCSFVETIGLSDFASEIGADALLISAPYYFKNISTIGLIDYFWEILSRTRLPAFLYNMPQNTQVAIGHEVIQRLMAFKHLLGLKDSTGEWNITRGYIESFRPLHIFVGNDSLLESGLEAGAGGSITAITNSLPELVMEVYRSVPQSDYRKFAQQRLSAVRKLLQDLPIHAATKFILYLRGFEESAVRPPLQNLSEAQKLQLERSLTDLGIEFQDDQIVLK